MTDGTVDRERETGNRPKLIPLAEKVQRLLLSRIMSGEYRTNHKLPTEHELAAEFGVSRPIVRDALEALRKKDLIYSRRGAGSFVSDKAVSRDLGFAPVETIADIQRCYEFRLTIEPEAAFYAARRRNDALIEQIHKSLELLNAATQQLRHKDDADFAFHLAIAEASNNHYYVSSMQALKGHIGVGMRLHGQSLLGSRENLQHVYNEHEAVFRAIVAGDAERARDEMRSHVRTSCDRLFEGKMLDLSL